MASVALAAYLAASWLAGLAARPVLSRRMARGKEDPARIGERLGHGGAERPAGALVWLHGASVGESLSAIPLIHALARAEPDLEFLVTTGTVTAARRMAGALPDRARHQYVPVDTAGAVSRFLDHWRPDLAIWIESELWPRLIWQTRANAVPMALVNARLSARSHARWRRLPGMAKALLGAFDLILTQDEPTVARLADLGRPAGFSGNLKAAVQPPDASMDEVKALSGVLSGRPVWLAASTHPDEEEIVLAAHRDLLSRHPDALMILAPRHPGRGDELARLLETAGLSFAQRSAGETPSPGTTVWLADTLGEMGLWYRLAPVSFVGGSLTDRGGHTPFEPVLLGSAVVHGPDTRNFAPAYAALAEAEGALRIEDAGGLATAVFDLLQDPQRRAAMTQAAARAHRAITPDVDAIAAQLLALMGTDRP